MFLGSQETNIYSSHWSNPRKEIIMSDGTTNRCLRCNRRFPRPTVSQMSYNGIGFDPICMKFLGVEPAKFEELVTSGQSIGLVVLRRELEKDNEMDAILVMVGEGMRLSLKDASPNFLKIKLGVTTIGFRWHPIDKFWYMLYPTKVDIEDTVEFLKEFDSVQLQDVFTSFDIKEEFVVIHQDNRTNAKKVIDLFRSKVD